MTDVLLARLFGFGGMISREGDLGWCNDLAGRLDTSHVTNRVGNLHFALNPVSKSIISGLVFYSSFWICWIL